LRKEIGRRPQYWHSYILDEKKEKVKNEEHLLHFRQHDYMHGDLYQQEVMSILGIDSSIPSQ